MLVFEELYEDQEHIFMITELLNSGSLSDKKDTLISKDFAQFTLKSILQLLVYLSEQNIIHRDIKPGNIMFHKDQNKQLVCKLIDFGLCADTTDKSKDTLLKDRAGTVCYLAPELIECDPLKGYYNHKVDVYSIAMVFWEMLIGRNPVKTKRRPEDKMSKSKEYR
jgi:serine/threonine protein kinase